MYFLKNFIKVFYFTIGIFLFLDIFFSSIYGYNIGPVFILFYIVFSLPIIEKIYSNILKDTLKKYDFKFRGINVLKYFFLMILFFVLFQNNFSFFEIFFYLLGIFSLVFFIDSRFVFFLALVLLIFVVGFIIVDNKTIAENLSIISYYFLILGVVISIYENFNGSNLEKNEI